MYISNCIQLADIVIHPIEARENKKKNIKENEIKEIKDSI